MDKSRVCISRTINLAKYKNPTKSSLLMHENLDMPSVKKPKQKCSGRPGLSPMAAPAVKRIKICTGAEMKKMCKPPPCVCPPPPKGAWSLNDAIAFFFKAMFATSIIYWTVDAGLWGDSEDTEELYQALCNMFTDPEESRKKYLMSGSCEYELELITEPADKEDLCRRPPICRETIWYRVQELYNKWITCAFKAVAGFPGNLMSSQAGEKK